MNKSRVAESGMGRFINGRKFGNSQVKIEFSKNLLEFRAGEKVKNKHALIFEYLLS